MKMRALYVAALLIMTGVMIAGCPVRQNAPVKADASLTETYWKLTAIGENAVETPSGQSQAHLIFRAGEGRVKGSGGCNRIMGSYTLTGKLLHFGQLAATRMICPDMEGEQALLSTLEKVDGYKISGESMQLFEKNTAILSFEAVYLP
jgi:heat shock protein HslJ